MSFSIKRRKLIKAGAASVLVASAATVFLESKNAKKLNNVKFDGNANTTTPIPDKTFEHELAVKDNLQKVKFFNQTFSDDLFLTKEKYTIFQQALKRILRVQKVIGYANFNLVSFDDMILYSNRFPQIGRFTKEELALIDELFFYDANKYGFYGSKVIKDLTSKVSKKETVKIAGSGHYLFYGDALTKFNQLKKDVGPDLILTSGVRSVVKQLQLFLAKLDESKGNLSLASRSLAPPGHSYHGIGDFDVGKKGFGKLNFTAEFSSTDEYKKLIELKYVDLRYTKDNQVGVRYEPWHIKVV
ncbi:MAG: M15 family metallopeptidase [Gammaproteobacteria bacterium]|nr:M15 family metallopeptidase [Gammaproteobacteria bacterium]MCW8986732.1 M15 family metallopeptidase [Gammaproteobacteria bacterium]MCW9031103.1 M15 family metallopeptidase [Gammaproteobacteria bacterium]